MLETKVTQQSNCQTISVRVEVPAGWRLVAFRNPKNGDRYVSANSGKILTAPHDFENEKHFVIRPVYRFAEWMKRGLWLWQSANGVWWLSEVKPEEMADVGTWGVAPDSWKVSVARVSALFLPPARFVEPLQVLDDE